MSDWIHALPLGWMAVLIFRLTFLSTAVIHWVVQSLVLLLIAAHDRPFVGQSGVRPTVLLEVQPDAAVGSSGR